MRPGFCFCVFGFFRQNYRNIRASELGKRLQKRLATSAGIRFLLGVMRCTEIIGVQGQRR